MKYDGIGDLIDENIELKRLLRKQKIDGLKGMLSFVELIKPLLIKARGYSVEEHIKELKKELNKYETLEK